MVKIDFTKGELFGLSWVLGLDNSLDELRGAGYSGAKKIWKESTKLRKKR